MKLARPLPGGAAVGAVRRPQAARRDRPCLRRRPAAGGLRRADVGARRLGAGGDPQPAGRAAARRADGVPVHLARPRRRPLPVRPDRRAVPGPADGAGPGGASVLGRRTTRTPRRCSRPCRRSRAASGRGSSCEGEIPSAANPPSGCVFQTRCPRKLGEICETTEPPLAEVEPGHMMRCHIPLDELADAVRGGGRGVITRAAVLERVGAPLEVTELELAPPGPGRGARAAARERRLPLRPERHRRHGRDALPCGAGPRGRRRGRAPSGRASPGSPRAPTSPSPGRRPAATAPSAWTTCRTCAAPRGR